jgi:hypothetical protein
MRVKMELLYGMIGLYHPLFRRAFERLKARGRQVRQRMDGKLSA